MWFTKPILDAASLLFIGSIVVPVRSSVNYNDNNNQATGSQLADGMPLPPPHGTSGPILVSDGMHLPPPHRVIGTAINV
jgi:hypothetical protein